MSKHTPGPWVAHPQCSVSGWVDITQEGEPFGLPFAACKHFNEVANARLIAAAPDLLEALRVFVDFPADTFDGDHDAPFTLTARLADMRRARAAITKATGSDE